MGESERADRRNSSSLDKRIFDRSILFMVTMSVVIGACSYMIAAACSEGVMYAYYGAPVGVVAGILQSPFFVRLRYKRTELITLLVVFPTLLFSLAAGGIMQTSAIGLPLPIGCFIISCIIASGGLPDRRYPSGLCQRCGYNLTGLTDQQPCPECGAKRTAQDSESDQPAEDPAG